MANLNLKLTSELDGAQADLVGMCDSLAEDLKNGIKVTKENYDEYGGAVGVGELVPAYRWLDDVLDYEFIVDSKGQYKAARLLLSFGGPNVWLDLGTKEIQGFWGGDEYIKYVGDAYMLDEIDEEIEQIYANLVA